MTRLRWLVLTTLFFLVESYGNCAASEPIKKSPTAVVDAEDCPYCAATSVTNISSQAALPLHTNWQEIKIRKKVDFNHILFVDQDGAKGQLDSLIDRPTLITFFYTRCQNSSKCAAVVSQLAALQKKLKKSGRDNRFRIVGITYEPQYDEPQRLKRYGVERGIEFNDTVRFLQLALSDQKTMIERLQAPVNYNSEWVTSHGVELTLLDSKSRLVRKYHTMIWDNDQVVQDLNKLLAETN